MNITSSITRATRRIHSLAVALHMMGLRAAIKGATIRASRAVDSMNKARAVADVALDAFEESVSVVNDRKVDLETVRIAANIEAKQIGGTL